MAAVVVATVIVLVYFLSCKVLGEVPSQDGGPCGVVLKEISVFPGDEDYTEATEMYNPLYSQIKPAFVALPRTEEDVMKCLQCSVQHATPCVVKSGGHDNAGYSTVDGTKNNAFVINLAKMQAISVNPDTVQVQAGARWGDVYELLNQLNSQQLITGGICPIVGMGGFSLGGGYSMLSRKYGLAIDNVLSMRMVTADGSRVVFVNETVNSDLFWALRGGGGGNFGIVTEFTYKTHTVAKQNYSLVEFIFEGGIKSQDALTVIGQINSQLPRDVYLDMLIAPNKELSVFGVFLGMYEEGIQHLKPLLDLASQTHYSSFTSYYSLAYEVGSKRGYIVPVMEHPYLLRGCILKQLDPSAVNVMFSLDFPDGCAIAFMHLGGAIADISATDTAYFSRQGSFEYYSPCLYQNKDEEREVFAFEEELYTELNSNGHCAGSYVNDIDRLLPEWQDSHFGLNYPKLQEVKEKWNPVGVGHFHFPQEIGSSYSYEDDNR